MVINNKIKTLLIEKLSKVFFVKSFYTGRANIFMLHRISTLESNKISANENLKVSPEFLDNFIQQSFSHGYTFISLNQLYSLLKNGGKVKKQIVLTLDDEYRDNYENAYPIFKKYEIPFTIYLMTDFPEKKEILWWYGLEDLILQNNQITLSNGISYSCFTLDQKNEVF